MPYTIDVSADSTAPPEVLFEHLAVAEAWGVWGGLPAKPTRAREGDTTPNGVGAIRKVGTAREQVVRFDPPGHYSYTGLRTGLPIKGYRADVTFTSLPGGGTTVRWHSTFEPLFPGSGAVAKLFLTWMLGRFARRLAAHAERCEPGCPAHRPG